jgi:hypothetical protein
MTNPEPALILIFQPTPETAPSVVVDEGHRA